MHTIQRCLLNIHNLVIGKNDSKKVREQEKQYKRFPEIWPITTTCSSTSSSSSNVNLSKSSAGKKRKVQSKESTSGQAEDATLTKTTLPHPPYVILDTAVCNSRFSKVKFPFGTGMKVAPIFTTTSSLNSHDWKELACRGILKFCYRGMLGERQEKSLFRFFDCVSRLFAEIHNLDGLNQLEEDLNESLALLERDFPVEIQNITQHLLHHLVDGIRRFGPLYSTWMFGFERLNGWCSQRAVNKRHPESTIIETYLLYDFSQFLAATGIINKRYLEGSEENMFENSTSSSRNISLTKAILDDLFKYYCKKNTTLNSLWDLYVADREKMKKNSVVSFHEWEPKGRNLTKKERFLTQPLNPSAKSMAIYHLENDNIIRTVTFSTDSAATESSNSSIVCLNPNISVSSEFKFGKILKIFEHTGYGMNYVFCIVELIDTIYDISTGLRKCKDFSGMTHEVAEINTLSAPLAHACDEDWSWILY